MWAVRLGRLKVAGKGCLSLWLFEPLPSGCLSLYKRWNIMYKL